jgi:AcrR family transcriptional regulator
MSGFIFGGTLVVRVTAEAKVATRCRILEAARARFSEVGFEAATTRDIASAARIAVGTLFNYFPSKEAIAMAMVAEALGEARRRFEGSPRGESLEEDLFALIVAELRGLRPHRNHLRPVLETALSPLARADASPEGEAIRVEHLETVGRLVDARVPGKPLSPVALNLYWTLYTGVLAFWACDSSPKQEDTLAVLDHYLRAFMGSLKQEDTVAVLDQYLRAFMGSLQQPE